MGNKSGGRRIETFIFLDLETTGCFPDDRLNPLNAPSVPGDVGRDLKQILNNHIRMTSSRQAPSIVEIGLVAVSRNSIRAGIQQIFRHKNEVSMEVSSSFVVRLPSNVINSQVRPMLSEMEWSNYEELRLKQEAVNYSQSDLESKNAFDLEWKIVRLFLEQAPKPACIIAHNGLRFDFRILHAEFERYGLLQSKPIPDEIYFVDSMLMFLDLDKKHNDELRLVANAVDFERIQRTLVRDENIASRKQVSPPEASEISVISEEMQLHCSKSAPNSLIKSTEENSAIELKRPARRRLFPDVPDDHPLHFLRTTQWSPAKKKRMRADFFQRSDEGYWYFDNHLSIQKFREKGTYKLESMYNQLVDCEYDAHYAEEDCKALLQVCLHYGDEFVEYVNAYAAKFPF